MQDFREVKVWAKSHQLALDIYQVTASFPKAELFGLTSQIRRSCASVPANIAEGCGRGGKNELARYLAIAAGSASELQYHILLARDLTLLDTKTHSRLSHEIDQVMKMLTAFIRTLRLPSEILEPTTHDS